MDEQHAIPSHAPGVYVSGAELDLDYHPPEVHHGAHFTVGASEFDEDDPEPYWFTVHTLATDSYMIALMWAHARLQVADDGTNPMPVAKVVMHKQDPFEIDWDAYEEGEIAAYLTGDGVIEGDDERFGQIAAATREWSEIVRTQGDDAADG
jgi:hypothetical protein